MRWGCRSVVGALLRRVVGVGALALVGGPVAVSYASPSAQITTPASQFREFHGASCLSSTSCTAVGGGPDGKVIAGRWDGTGWSAQSVPNPPGDSGFLAGVSCASSTRCMAVGNTM